MLFNSYKRDYLRRRKKKPAFAVITVIIIALLIYFFSTGLFRSDKSSRYDTIIYSMAKKYNLNPFLVKAVVWRESRFKANASGAKGEIGLMQIMQNAAVKDWENYNKRKIEDKAVLFNPHLNIEIGCWYLARCRKHWKKYKDSLPLTLAEYNAGYSNVKKWVGEKDYKSESLVDKIGFPTTKSYVLSILKKYNELKND